MKCPEEIPLVKSLPHYNIFDRIGELDFPKLTALNLGAGDYESVVARQVCFMPFKKLVSVDGYEPCREEALKMQFAAKTHEYRISLIQDIPKENFDVVMAFDLIEHLPKADGEKLLDKLDKMAKIIFMFVPLEPEGYHRPNPDEANVLQAHISHWTEADFKKRGYVTEVLPNIHGAGDIHWDGLYARKEVK